MTIKTKIMTMKNLIKCTVRLTFMVLMTKTMPTKIDNKEILTFGSQKMRYINRSSRNQEVINVTDNSNMNKTSTRQ